MVNALLKIDHKIVHEYSNAALTPIYMVAVTPNRTVVQGCDNAVYTYRHTNTTTVTYCK